jgi:hypothetical protein
MDRPFAVTSASVRMVNFSFAVAAEDIVDYNATGLRDFEEFMERVMTFGRTTSYARST